MARERKGTLIEPRGKQGNYCAIVTRDVDGETVREWINLGTDNRQAAKRKLAREVAKIARGEKTSPEEAASEETVEDYGAAWVEDRRAVTMGRDERRNLSAYILPEIGKMPMSKVTSNDVLGVLRAARDKGLSRQTVKHIRGVMRRLFESWARASEKGGVYPSNPVIRVTMAEVFPGKKKGMRKERCILTDAEFEQFAGRQDVDLEIRLLGLVARILGGLRTSDAHVLDWSMFDRVHFEKCTIYRSKTDDKQAFPKIPAVVSEALRSRWEAAGRPEAGPVFPARRGPRAGKQKALRGNSYAGRLRRGLMKAGVKRHACTRAADAKPPKRGESCCPSMAHDPLYSETTLTLPVDFHSFRRALISAGAAANVNIQTMMSVAHHSDERTHMGYVIGAPEIPDVVIPKLPLGLFHEKQQPATKHLAEAAPQNQNAESFLVLAPLAQLDRASASGAEYPQQLPPPSRSQVIEPVTTDAEGNRASGGALLFGATFPRPASIRVSLALQEAALVVAAPFIRSRPLLARSLGVGGG